MSTENATPADAPVEGVPKEGDLIAGKYRIEKVLGQGGMGIVVAAQHTQLRQKVAIKLLLPEAAKLPDASERFQREARASFAIQSEHVARVLDVGVLDNGSPYMVMEYLTGSDLDDVLSKRGRLPIAEAVDYILQACEAVAEAHALGIIHRDLKPSNLFVSEHAGRAVIKVVDFGLSKATQGDGLDPALTAANVVMGTPNYMSPEQIKSLKGLDARTDIWALGIILYQCLCGVVPFDSTSLGALFIAISGDPAAPPRTRRPEIPAGLEAAVLACLEKDVARRTQTVGQLARALAPFGTDEARLSTERICRRLGEPLQPPSEPPVPGDLSSQRLEEGDEMATLAWPGTRSNPPPGLESFRPPPAPPPAAAIPGPPLVMGAAPPPGAAKQWPSGSMAAVARDGAGGSVPPPARGAARSNAGLLVAVVGGAVLVLVGVAIFALRGGGGPSPAPGTEAPPSATTSAAPTPAPPSATATVAPGTTASAAAPPADSAAPGDAEPGKPGKTRPRRGH